MKKAVLILVCSLFLLFGCGEKCDECAAESAKQQYNASIASFQNMYNSNMTTLEEYNTQCEAAERIYIKKLQDANCINE